MIACHCRAVSDRDVSRSIAEGARSLRDLADECGAGSRCGGCHLVLARMLADAGLTAQAEAAAVPGYCAA